MSSSAKRVSSHAPILSLSSVTKRYGDKEALSSVSFTVEPGEAVALWGPNGAGKTTALLSLMGLITFEGEIRVDELDPRVKGRSARAQIGFVPQEIGIQGDIRVEEIIRFISQLRRVPVEATLALAVRLGLEDHLTHEVSALSGGLRQRLALVLALASDPPILLLDEPSANLDSEGRRALLEFLGKLKADGKTLVFTSHREEEVRFLADRVLHLADGRLLRESTTEVGPDDRGLHLVTPGTSEGTNS